MYDTHCIRVNEAFRAHRNARIEGIVLENARAYRFNDDARHGKIGVETGFCANPIGPCINTSVHYMLDHMLITEHMGPLSLSKEDQRQ